MPERDDFTWNIMIAGYANSRKITNAHKLFDETPMKSSITWSSQFPDTVHGYAIKTQFDANVFVMTGLVGMYAQCRWVDEAKYLFKMMSHDKNHVTWTAMITGYSRNQDQLGAIECFRDMRVEGIEANQYTFPSVLAACGEIMAFWFAVQVHGCIVKGGFVANVFVESVLVEMYA
ncbi:putative tetratricopeptide-like helical domain superfamily [Helianthus anomalus]